MHKSVYVQEVRYITSAWMHNSAYVLDALSAFMFQTKANDLDTFKRYRRCMVIKSINVNVYEWYMLPTDCPDKCHLQSSFVSNIGRRLKLANIDSFIRATLLAKIINLENNIIATT